MTTRGKGTTERPRHARSKNLRNGPEESLVQLQQRAAEAARHMASLAVPGSLAFEQLKARNAEFRERVAKKLEVTPLERLRPPPANIAVQAMLQYALLGDGPDVAELREMFENLVARSMDRDAACDAHPAFVSMISQLLPDEARLLGAIAANGGGLLKEMERYGAMSMKLRHLHLHLSNFERLGILRTEPLDTFSGRGPSTRLTPIGEWFLVVCVHRRGKLPTARPTVADSAQHPHR